MIKKFRVTFGHSREEKEHKEMKAKVIFFT